MYIFYKKSFHRFQVVTYWQTDGRQTQGHGEGNRRIFFPICLMRTYQNIYHITTLVYLVPILQNTSPNRPVNFNITNVCIKILNYTLLCWEICIIGIRILNCMVRISIIIHPINSYRNWLRIGRQCSNPSCGGEFSKWTFEACSGSNPMATMVTFPDREQLGSETVTNTKVKNSWSHINILPFVFMYLRTELFTFLPSLTNK
jgi:hypothetical protein